MKATAIAPSNLAFIKYWGKIDEKLRLSANCSISMNLSNLLTTTTVEFSQRYSQDEVIIDGLFDVQKSQRVVEHLDRMRKITHMREKARVVSKNNFPTSTGLSSSASGFAALTLAGTKALGLSLSEKELSILARQASGSACRSIPSGFVEWIAGSTSETSYAVSIFPPDFWRIVDIVVLVSSRAKDVATSEAQKSAFSSSFMRERLKLIGGKISHLKNYIKVHDFIRFGELVEAEALELHAIMFTAKPTLIYLLPETVLVMRLVKEWRVEGLPVYFSLNTGQDVHLLCMLEHADEICKRLRKLTKVKKIILNRPTYGSKLINKHLF